MSVHLYGRFLCSRWSILSIFLYTIYFKMKPTTTFRLTKIFYIILSVVHLCCIILSSAFGNDFELSAMNLFHFSSHSIIALSFSSDDMELYLKAKRNLKFILYTSKYFSNETVWISHLIEFIASSFRVPRLALNPPIPTKTS